MANKGKKSIKSININGFDIDIQSLSSIQYFYEYDDIENEGTNALNYIIKEFNKDLREKVQIMLFAVNPDWLEDSKIVRYKKYWNELKNHNLLKGKVHLEHQHLFEDNGLIRYGLICSISNQYFASLLQYSLENKTSGMFILNNNDNDFEMITKNLFEMAIYKSNNKLSSLIDWKGFVSTIVANSGIALIPQGWYDFGAVYLNIIKG